ncbi:DUF4386 domain-containing protein [Neobacillus piezotolerans]|uniref:DUF4386 domain-containing protein n=1 Tax=Neobacillus piezotolerans TaxID=2259171 RepID=A0A3D8GTY8_9BACI|nr:DUF4386 domain-containing protein [Neobacillus piezotolerans]RDU37812.1 DUF4386 domain-containing protein [Neobacillus piezotolerans]
MYNSVFERSPQRKAALAAGTGLIIMCFAAFFSYGLVLGKLVSEGDAGATFQNIISSHAFFNYGILGWLIVLVCDIVVAWGFYIFLKPVNKHLSLLGLLLRLIYTGILGIAVANLVQISILTNGPLTYSSLDIQHLKAFVMLFLKAFQSMWSIGLIIFGGHLLIVGFITFKSGIVPRIIGILLLVASIAYISIHFNYVFLPQLNGITKVMESILSVPMFLGEISFGVWLLVKGGKIPRSG